MKEGARLWHLAGNADASSLVVSADSAFIFDTFTVEGVRCTTMDEKLAEQIYEAVTELLRDTQTTGLLTAVGDAKMRVSYDKASPKTRMIFTTLAANLTRVQGKR
jgi:hypothetical protein